MEDTRYSSGIRTINRSVMANQDNHTRHTLRPLQRLIHLMVLTAKMRTAGKLPKDTERKASMVSLMGKANKCTSTPMADSITISRPVSTTLLQDNIHNTCSSTLISPRPGRRSNTTRSKYKCSTDITLRLVSGVIHMLLAPALPDKGNMRCHRTVNKDSILT